MNPEQKDAVDRCFQLTQQLLDIFDPQSSISSVEGIQLQKLMQTYQVRCDISHEKTEPFCAEGENLEFTIAMKTAKIRELVKEEPGWARLSQKKLQDYTKSTVTSIFTMFGGIYWQYGEVLQDIARYEILERIPGYEIKGLDSMAWNTVDTDEASDRIVYHATKDIGEMFTAMLTTLMMVTFIVCFIRFVYFNQPPITNPLEALFRRFLQKQLNIGPDQVEIDFEIVAGSRFFGTSEEARMHVTIRPKLFPQQWSKIFNYTSDGGQQSPTRMFKKDFEDTLPTIKIRDAFRKIDKAIKGVKTNIDITERRAAQLKREAINEKKAGNKRAAIAKMKQEKVVSQNIKKLNASLLTLEQQHFQLDQSLVNQAVLESSEGTLAALKEQKQIKPEEVAELLDDIQDERENVVEVAGIIGSPSDDFTDIELEAELQQMNAKKLAETMPIVPTTPIEIKKKQSLEAGWYMRQWKTRLEAGGSVDERRSFNRVLQQYK